ncbi:MAG: hypothetical protein JXA42_08240, partial [Anaerolineales bacterium]|nr:hypothetical protein [Anaerolineales bacterium]
AAIAFLAIEGLLHLMVWTISGGSVSVAELTDEQLRQGGGLLGRWLFSGFESAVGRLGSALLCLALFGIGLVLVIGVTMAQLGRVLVQAFSTLWRTPAEPGPVRETEHFETTRQPVVTVPVGQPLREADVSPPSEQIKEEEKEELPETDQPGLFYGDAVRMASIGYPWQLPEIQDLLEPGSENTAANAQIREQVEIIEHTLTSFGAPGRVVEINPGPVITQFGVEPLYIERRNGQRTKVKVGQINSLADDLALALAAQSIRIEAPVPGKGYIGIEVPNADVSIVSLRDVMESEQFTRAKTTLKIGLGQDVSGNAVIANLAQMPHLLIAGATGSGKSVCVNGIVACLLINNTPDQLRLLMVDPKRVELTGYNGIPHLLTPVIVDLDKVVGTLQWVTREMDSRYRRFAEAGSRNISDYNRKVDEKLPYIVVIIDELADLMMMAPDETERTVCRLAQMARATGIHLVIATQRPSVDVVTGLIKANFPARIAFAVASSTDSRVILDSTGAERLLGRGDMLLMKPDAAQPQRLQGSYVSDEELRRLVDFWRKQRVEAVLTGKAQREQKKPDVEKTLDAEPKPEPIIASPMQQPLWEEMIEKEQRASEQDEMMGEAIAIVREGGKASVSLLQRRLRIGYTRAARLIDAMEEQGIVGPHPGGSRQRQVLLPPLEEESQE